MTRRRFASGPPRLAAADETIAREHNPRPAPARPSVVAQADRRARQHAAIAAIGARALAATDCGSLLDEAVRVLSDALEAEFVKVLELTADGETLRWGAVVGWRLPAEPERADDDPQARYTLRTNAPVIVEDVEQESRFLIPPAFGDHGIASGVSVVIGARDRAFGVLCAHATRAGRFDAADASMLQSAAAMLAFTIERDRAQRALNVAESELRHYRDLLQGVTDTIPVTLAYVDAQGVYRWINRRGAERHGRTREDIVGRTMRELFGDPYWNDVLAPYVRRVLAGETIAYDRTLQRPDGATVQIETHLSPALGPDGSVEGLCVLTVDVTERTRITQALARSVSLLQATLESTAEGILVVDDAGRVTEWNRQFAQLWGVPETLLTNNDGRATLELARDQVRDPEGFIARVCELQASPEAESFDLLELKDGRLIERCSKPQRINGVPVGRVWSFRDVTERQRAREALERANDGLEMRVAQRTSQLAAAHREAETLSYSIAHDLRAPLRAISGYARILCEDMAARLPAEASDLLERIGLNAERMGTLIDALLGFGQLSRQPLTLVRVDLDRVVDEVLGWMQADLEDRRIEVRREPLGTVQADASLARIAITNLLSNAIKFSRGRDPARIEIGRTSVGGETVYYVRDNGAGFDMRYAAKLFGMFQRLHSANRFEGSGVGLASVQQIVQRHGGRIWAESAEGEGATFYFTLGG